MGVINLIIFRIPSDDGEPTLVEIEYADGVLAISGYQFTVEEGDTYANLPFDRVVLAEKQDDGSISHAVYQLGKSYLKTPENVYDIPHESLQHIVSFLIHEHEKTQAEVAASNKKLH